MNKTLKKRMRGKGLKDRHPDWDRITFKDEVPRPWEREKEAQKARQRKLVEVEIPQEFLKKDSPGQFPLKRVWLWAKEKYPDRRLFFRGHKLFMVEEVTKDE